MVKISDRRKVILTKQNKRGKKLTAVMMSAVLLAGLLAGCTGKSTKPSASDQSDSKAASEDDSSDDQNKYRKVLDKFAEKLEARMKEDGIPGASVSVAENGETIYSKGFGYANQDKKIPVDENTLFYILGNSSVRRNSE